MCVRKLYVSKLCVSKLFVSKCEEVVCEQVAGRREEEDGKTDGCRIKNKNPTQRCGELNR